MQWTIGTYEPFSNYYKHLTPFNSSNNIWLYRVWEELFGCDWSGNNTCNQYGNITYTNQEMFPWISKFYDGVWVYAYALDNLIKEKCPDAFTHQSQLKNCVNGRSLLPYMKNVTFNGVTGRIKFNSNGDMIGAYDILQYIKKDSMSKYISVGFWSKNADNLVMYDDRVQHHNLLKSPEGNEKIVGIPKSVCSEPCLPKQYKNQKELPCCWECLHCRENEIIINGSRCKQCEEFTWPDEKTATQCRYISPSYMKLEDPLAISLIVLTCFIICCYIAIIVLFHMNRDVKLIKASSKELTTITFSRDWLRFTHGLYLYCETHDCGM